MEEIELTDKLARCAAKFGYIGLFAHRKTLQKATNDAVTMIESIDGRERGIAMTAMMIVLNTTAITRAQQLEVVNELRELARATKAYCIEDSRSMRRQDAMITGAEAALEHAEEVFGPEDK